MISVLVMSSVEDRNLESPQLDVGLNDKEEIEIQNEIDILIDFMAVSSIMWAHESPEVALELATCARVTLDKLLGFCRHKKTVKEDNIGGKPWDFSKILGSLGGETLGEIIYWATKAKCVEIPSDAKMLLEEFMQFVGMKVEGSYIETGEKVLNYLSKALNRTLASLVIATRRLQ